MSLFGSLMADVEDDPFFGSHMRHMRHMNNMMNSLFSDPFGMLGGGPMAIAGPRHNSSLMPFMGMPSMNRLFSADLDGGIGSSYSSSTVVMSSGPHGKPQVYSSSSSTKIGPNGVKETKKTLQDSRTGTKKMSIGHHIGERAHVIEREQNVYSGEREERQDFINLDEDEAEQFDREFQAINNMYQQPMRAALPAPRRSPTLAITSASAADVAPVTNRESSIRTPRRPSARRPLRTQNSPLTTSASVREVYAAPHPQRHRHKQYKHRTHEN